MVRVPGDRGDAGANGKASEKPWSRREATVLGIMKAPLTRNTRSGWSSSVARDEGLVAAPGTPTTQVEAQSRHAGGPKRLGSHQLRSFPAGLEFKVPHIASPAHRKPVRTRPPADPYRCDRTAGPYAGSPSLAQARPPADPFSGRRPGRSSGGPQLARRAARTPWTQASKSHSPIMSSDARPMRVRRSASSTSRASRSASTPTSPAGYAKPLFPSRTGRRPPPPPHSPPQEAPRT